MFPPQPPSQSQQTMTAVYSSVPSAGQPQLQRPRPPTMAFQQSTMSSQQQLQQQQLSGGINLLLHFLY
jgi:hypothetical protein